jgi:predicted nucleic acid-binding protein
MIYTLDANVLTDAIRTPDGLDQLKGFLSWALPQTVLSSVVASELLAGARNDNTRRLVEEEFLGPFSRRRRIVAPSERAWYRMGILRGQLGKPRPSPDWQNDALLACSARELGWIVITRDADLRGLQTKIRGLHVEAPYPRRRVRKG